MILETHYANHIPSIVMLINNFISFNLSRFTLNCTIIMWHEQLANEQVATY